MADVTSLIDDKRASILAEISSLESELEELEQLKMKNKSQAGIEKWVGFSFESSSGLTEEFATFAKEFKAYLKKELSNEFEIVNINRGHFYLSGFVKNKKTGKVAYFSSDDVRWSDGWFENLLIRTAQHEKDYTGGSNCFTKLLDIKAGLLRLTT